MPGGRKMGSQPTAKSEQQRTMYGSFGKVERDTVGKWDPKTETLVQATLQLISEGYTVVFRPGSGARSMGVALWLGDTRDPPVWIYDAEELDDWANWVIDQGRGRIAAD